MEVSEELFEVYGKCAESCFHLWDFLVSSKFLIESQIWMLNFVSDMTPPTIVLLEVSSCCCRFKNFLKLSKTCLKYFRLTKLLSFESIILVNRNMKHFKEACSSHIHVVLVSEKFFLWNWYCELFGSFLRRNTIFSLKLYKALPIKFKMVWLATRAWKIFVNLEIAIWLINFVLLLEFIGSSELSLKGIKIPLWHVQLQFT